MEAVFNDHPLQVQGLRELLEQLRNIHGLYSGVECALQRSALLYILQGID
jgi:hypothetical protein